MKNKVLLLGLLVMIALSDAYSQNIKTYKARRGDTMEKIAGKYKLSVETLRHYNSVYKDTPLKKGDIIIIPDSDVIPSTPAVDTPYNTQMVVKEIDFTGAEFIEHTVLPKETKYGISRRYSITQDDLTRLNSILQTLGLQAGMVLKIPVLTQEQKEQSTQNIAAIENMQGVQTTSTFHVVRPKETKYGISRHYGITEEQLCAMNPHLRTEMPRIGETLRIPHPIVVAEPEVKDTVVVSDTIVIDTIPSGKYSHIPVVNVDVILPFYTDKIEQMESLPEKDRFRESRTALTFYNGVLMALDSLGKDGMRIQARVHDSRRDISTASGIVSYNDFSQTDVVIGPLFAEVAEFVVKSLASSSPALVVSPLSQRHDIASYPHLVQSTASSSTSKETMGDYLVENLPSKTKVILLTSEKTTEDDQYLKARLVSRVGVGNVLEMPLTTDSCAYRLMEKFTEGYNTVLASTISADVMNPLTESMDIPEGDLPHVKIYAIGADARGRRAMQALSGSKATAMTFIYTSSYYEDKSHAGYDDFVTAYRARFHQVPSQYAIQGFDVTYDMLSRYIKAMETSSSERVGVYTTQGIAGRYYYRMHSGGGYENTALYILSYKKSEGESLLQ